MPALVEYGSTKEYYEDPQELFLESDLVEADIEIVGWKKKFRVRALTFEQMQKITELSTNTKGEIDQLEWTYRTITAGVIRPKFTYEQAKKLGEKNGQFVETLADEIWKLGRIGKYIFDTYIKELNAKDE